MASSAKVEAWRAWAVHLPEPLDAGARDAQRGIVAMADMLERAAAILDDYDRYWDEDDLPQRTRAWMDEWRGESPSETDESAATSPSGADDAGGYRLARGCVRSVSDERPEDTIRRLRGDPQADA